METTLERSAHSGPECRQMLLFTNKNDFVFWLGQKQKMSKTRKPKHYIRVFLTFTRFEKGFVECKDGPQESLQFSGILLWILPSGIISMTLNNRWWSRCAKQTLELPSKCTITWLLSDGFSDLKTPGFVEDLEWGIRQKGSNRGQRKARN